MQASATETIDDLDDAIPAAAQTESLKVKKQHKDPAKQPLSFFLIGSETRPGERQTLQWSSPQSPGGFAVSTPVIVVNGAQAGDVLCLTAAIHGDELNGIEIARQIVYGLNPQSLKGVVVSVPIVNLEGFWRRDRYIGDRRDLNRYFPGAADGAYPGRVAHALFTDIVKHCDILVDLHTGSFFRENLPQLRADLADKGVAELSRRFGALTVLQSVAPKGSLRGAATAAGIPAVVMEIGGPLSLEPDKVALGVKSLRAMMHSMNMVEHEDQAPRAQPFYYHSEWVRAEAGGILINTLNLGDKVEAGQSLAKIIDPVSNTTFNVEAPFGGTILGRAQNQFVSPGFAVFRVGTERTLKQLGDRAEAERRAAAEQEDEMLSGSQ